MFTSVQSHGERTRSAPNVSVPQLASCFLCCCCWAVTALGRQRNRVGWEGEMFPWTGHFQVSFMLSSRAKSPTCLGRAPPLLECCLCLRSARGEINCLLVWSSPERMVASGTLLEGTRQIWNPFSTEKRSRVGDSSFPMRRRQTNASSAGTGEIWPRVGSVQSSV